MQFLSFKFFLNSAENKKGCLAKARKRPRAITLSKLPKKYQVKKKDRTLLLDLVTNISQNEDICKKDVMEMTHHKKKRKQCYAIVSYQCIEFNGIQVGVLVQLFDGQILMKFLYTAEEQFKGCGFFTYGFSSLPHDCFQEHSFQVLYEHVILYRK